jgi:MFS family permease
VNARTEQRPDEVNRVPRRETLGEPALVVKAPDASIVNVALPSMGRDLNVGPDELSWVVNGYILMFGGFLLLGGRLADFLGRRRMYMLGLGVFALASLAGALAQSALWLVIACGAQGLGAALVSPAALALLMTLYAARSTRRAR